MAIHWPQSMNIIIIHLHFVKRGNVNLHCTGYGDDDNKNNTSHCIEKFVTL